jgi:hypothetical protein
VVSLLQIPKWKYADEMSFMHPYLHARDALTHLEADKFSLLEDRNETEEEEFLQAGSECDGTVEQEEQTPARRRRRRKRGGEDIKTTVSTVLMKYLVENNKQNSLLIWLTHFSKALQ